MNEGPDIKYEIEPTGCGGRHTLCRDLCFGRIIYMIFLVDWE